MELVNACWYPWFMAVACQAMALKYLVNLQVTSGYNHLLMFVDVCFRGATISLVDVC